MLRGQPLDTDVTGNEGSALGCTYLNWEVIAPLKLDYESLKSKQAREEVLRHLEGQEN